MDKLVTHFCLPVALHLKTFSLQIVNTLIKAGRWVLISVQGVISHNVSDLKRYILIKLIIYQGIQCSFANIRCFTPREVDGRSVLCISCGTSIKVIQGDTLVYLLIAISKIKGTFMFYRYLLQLWRIDRLKRPKSSF